MADQNYSADIKLALQDQVTPVLDKIDKRLNDLEKHFEQLEKTGDKSTSSLKRMGEVFGGVSLERGLEKSIEALKKFMDMAQEAIKIGLAEVEMVEKLGYSVAGLVGTTQVYTNAQGVAVTNAVRFNETLRLGKVVAEQLDAAESKLGLSTESMGQAFILNHARLSNANISLKDQIKLIEQLSTVGKAYNIDANSIPRQIQMLLSGNVGPRNQLAAVLGITELKDISKLLDQIKPKVEDATRVVELQNKTWAGGLVLVKKAYEDVLGDAMKPLSAELGSFTGDLLSFLNKPEVKDAFKDMGKNLVEAFQQVKPIIMDILAATVKISQFIAWLANQSTKGYGDVPQRSKQYRDVYGGTDVIIDAATGLPVGKNTGYASGYGSHYGPQTVESILDRDRGPSEVFSKNGPHVPTPEEIKAWEEQKKKIEETTNAISAFVDKSKAQSDIEDKLNAIDQERIKLLRQINATYPEMSRANIEATQKVVAATKDIKDRAIAEDAQKTLKAEQEKWDKSLKMAEKGIADGVALNEAAAYQETLQLASRNEDYDAYYAAIRQNALDAGKTEIEATTVATKAVKRLREDLVNDLLENGKTAADGTKAGMMVIMDSLKKESQVAFEYITGLWGDLGTNIERSIYEGMTGNTNFLKNFFKTIADDFAKNFAKSIKDTVMPQLTGFFQKLGFGASVMEGEQPSAEYGGGPGAPIAKQPGKGAQFGGAALAGLAAVAQIAAPNTLLGNEWAQAGISLGATIASTGIGVVVGAIVAALGVAISALTPRPAEMRGNYTGAAMAEAMRTGRARGTLGSDREVSDSYAISMSNSILSFFQDMFKKADPNFSRDILKGFKEQMIAYLEATVTMGVHAGGGADFKANIENLFTKIIPGEMMHLFFGQQTYKVGDPGGTTATGKGLVFGDSTSRSAVDASSPLVQFLTNLGFSVEKVQEIADQIDPMGPDAFQKYFSGIVGAVVEFQNNIKHLSQTSAQIFAAIDEAANPNLVKQFKEVGAGIVQMGSDLSLFTGQEQIDKAKELNDAADAYYKSAFEAMKALKAFMDEMAKQAQNFEEAATSYMKTPQWRYNDFLNFTNPNSGFNIQGLGEKAKNDPKTLQTLWNDFIQQATASLNYLIGLWNQLNSTLKTVKDVTKAFSDMDKALSRNVMDINTILGDLADYEGLLSKLSGLDPKSATYFEDLTQITQQVGQSLSSLYDEIYNFLQAVNSAQHTLDTSAASAIWNNNYAIAGNNDKSGTNGAQIGMIKSQIDADLAAIQSATDPGVVTQKSQDIYRLLGLYQGMFKPGDPNFNAAYQWANSVITKMQSIGTETLSSLGIQGSQAAHLLGEGGRDAVSAINLVEIAVGNVETAIKSLKDVVIEIRDLFTGYTTGTVDSILTEMQTVATALTTAMRLFTQAVGGPGTGPGGGPGTGPADQQNATVAMNNLALATTGAVGNENTGLIAFTNAVNAATAALAPQGA